MNTEYMVVVPARPVSGPYFRMFLSTAFLVSGLCRVLGRSWGSREGCRGCKLGASRLVRAPDPASGR